MTFEQEENYFKIFVFGLAVALSICPSGESKGLSGVNIVNITVAEPVRHDRRGFNNDVTLKWQILPFNETDVPSFRIWLTRNNKKEENVSVLVSQNASMNSFQYTFVHIFPGNDYTAHIESFSSMENVTSYVNITFDVNGLPYRDLISANFSEDDGYLMITWVVDMKLRELATPVVYNITLCSKDIPLPCNRTFLMCKATYHRHNGSVSSGDVQLYEQKWHKYMNEYTPKYLDRQQPLRRAWDSRSYRFSCGIYMYKFCKLSTPNMKRRIQYQVDFGDGRLHRQAKNIGFRKGFSHKPEFIKISFVKTKDPNRVIAGVHWRVKIICEPGLPDSIRIIVSGKTTYEKSFGKLQLQPIEDQIDNITYFKELVPNSMYTIHFVTESFWGGENVITKRIFWTPEGVPPEPTIQPILSQNDICNDNKRNVTVKWKLPPLTERNGIIRNITLRYYKKNHPKDAKEYFLANVTEMEIIGLDCYSDYQVQVRACNRGNKRCSGYSRAQVIKAKVRNNEAQATSDSNIAIWASVGGGLAFIIVALCACQYKYRRRRKERLESLTEKLDNKYYLTTELPKPDEYDNLY